MLVLRIMPCYTCHMFDDSVLYNLILMYHKYITQVKFGEIINIPKKFPNDEI